MILAYVHPVRWNTCRRMTNKKIQEGRHTKQNRGKKKKKKKSSKCFVSSYWEVADLIWAASGQVATLPPFLRALANKECSGALAWSPPFAGKGRMPGPLLLSFLEKTKSRIYSTNFMSAQWCESSVILEHLSKSVFWGSKTDFSSRYIIGKKTEISGGLHWNKQIEGIWHDVANERKLIQLPGSLTICNWNVSSSCIQVDSE